MTKTNQLLVLALAGALISAHAQASSFDLSIVGVGDFSKVNATNAPTSATVAGQSITNISATTKSKLGFGGGVLADAKFDPYFGIQFGALYITRKSETTTSFTVLNVNSSSSSITQTNYVQFPLLLRAWFNPYISIGGGGYYAQGVGNVKTLDTNGKQTNSQSWSNAQLKKSDYGVIGSLGIAIPLGGVNLLVDGRYLYGLKDIDASGTGEHQKYRDVQIIAGVTFPLGGGKF